MRRALATVLFIIGAILLMIASGFMVYAIGSNQHAQKIAATALTDTPTSTPTLNNNFELFLIGFSQALTSNDLATIATNSDQADFGIYQGILPVIGVTHMKTCNRGYYRLQFANRSFTHARHILVPTNHMQLWELIPYNQTTTLTLVEADMLCSCLNSLNRMLPGTGLNLR